MTEKGKGYSENESSLMNFAVCLINIIKGNSAAIKDY